MIRLKIILSSFTALLVIILISFVAAPSMVQKTVLLRIDPNKSESMDDYSSDRLNIWLHGIMLFAERPIFGHGQKTFKTLMYMRFGFGDAPHNQYLDYLVKFGIIGLVAYILIFLKLVQMIWNFQKSTTDLWEKKLFISYFAGLLGYTLSMLTVDLNQPRAIFWFYTAVFLRYGQLCMIGEEKNDAALA